MENTSAKTAVHLASVLLLSNPGHKHRIFALFGCVHNEHVRFEVE